MENKVGPLGAVVMEHLPKESNESETTQLLRSGETGKGFPAEESFADGIAARNQRELRGINESPF
jgi:hypothetical protein